MDSGLSLLDRSGNGIAPVSCALVYALTDQGPVIMNQAQQQKPYPDDKVSVARDMDEDAVAMRVNVVRAF